MIRCHAIVLASLWLPIGLFAQAPAALLGTWADDYGSRHQVSDTMWAHDGANRYQILRWDTAGQFAIARNALTNPGQPGGIL